MGNKLTKQKDLAMKFAALVALIGASDAAGTRLMNKDMTNPLNMIRLSQVETKDVTKAELAQVKAHKKMRLAQLEAGAREGDIDDYDHQSYQYPVQEQNFNGILGMLGTPTSMTNALHMQFN